MQNSITQKQAKSLAIDYRAFCEASDSNNALRLNVSAEMLLESQTITGIEIVATDILTYYIYRK